MFLKLPWVLLIYVLVYFLYFLFHFICFYLLQVYQVLSGKWREKFKGLFCYWKPSYQKAKARVWLLAQGAEMSSFFGIILALICLLYSLFELRLGQTTCEFSMFHKNTSLIFYAGCLFEASSTLSAQGTEKG